MKRLLNDLSQSPELPIQFGDCCPGVSKLLLTTLADHLPRKPDVILSVGCGSGLLEALLIAVAGDELDLYGIEVPACHVKYLPDHRVLRVPSTASPHSEAMLASALVFVYPRKSTLLAQYLDMSLGGALEQAIWLGHKNDWPDFEKLLFAAFTKIELFERPGIPDYELLVFATLPKSRADEQ